MGKLVICREGSRFIAYVNGPAEMNASPADWSCLQGGAVLLAGAPVVGGVEQRGREVTG